MRNDPATIEELRRNSQKPVGSDEVNFVTKYFFILGDLEGDEGLYVIKCFCIYIYLYIHISVLAMRNANDMATFSFPSLSLYLLKKKGSFFIISFIYNSHEKIRWLFCNTFPFFFRVLRLRKESVLTSTLSALPRPVKVFVRYLNMQQELHWWFQRRRSPRVALFCKKLKKLKKTSLSHMVSQQI